MKRYGTSECDRERETERGSLDSTDREGKGGGHVPISPSRRVGRSERKGRLKAADPVTRKNTILGRSFVSPPHPTAAKRGWMSHRAAPDEYRG